jgi:hypothetical protein
MLGVVWRYMVQREICIPASRAKEAGRSPNEEDPVMRQGAKAMSVGCNKCESCDCLPQPHLSRMTGMYSRHDR